MKKGFTLLEIMITLGILGIVLGIAFSMFDMSNLGWNTHNIQVELQQEARMGMEAMAKDLYLTDSGQITVDTISNIITFKVPVIIDTDETIPKDIYDTLGNIRWGAKVNDSDTYGIESYSIRYSRNTNTNQLIRDIIDSSSTTISSRVCANNLQALVFSPTPASPPTTLSITITCQRPSRPGSTTLLTATLISRVTFRN